MYQKVSLMMLVDDVNKAEAWYRNVLGEEVQCYLPQNPPFEWVPLMLDDVEIMIGKKEEAKKWYSEEVQVSETPTILDCKPRVHCEQVGRTVFGIQCTADRLVGGWNERMVYVP